MLIPRLMKSRDRSDAADEAVRGLILFTELNHGFINPVTEELTDAIYAAMGADLMSYVRSDSAATSYDGHTAVFTEMLNWALMSVYVQSKLDEAIASEVARNISDSPSLSEAIQRLATTDAKRWSVE